MVVLVDNGDSFSYSLAHYLGVSGVEVQLFRHNLLSLDKLDKLGPKAIILSSGPNSQAAKTLSMDIVECFAGNIPLLGVSSGHHLLAEVFGGELSPAPQPIQGRAVPVYHDGQTMYAGIPSPFLAARYHSLVVDKESLPECLDICAWTEDGLIMGIRHKEWAIEGVQFQPESILTEQGLALMKNFLHTYSLVES